MNYTYMHNTHIDILTHRFICVISHKYVHIRIEELIESQFH